MPCTQEDQGASHLKQQVTLLRVWIKQLGCPIPGLSNFDSLSRLNCCPGCWLNGLVPRLQGCALGQILLMALALWWYIVW
jgi:hypothetical protein